MLKRTLLAALLLVAVAAALLPVVGGASTARAPRYQAQLSGRQEVPVVRTAAFGQGYFLLQEDRWGEQCFRYAVLIDNIDHVIAAHLHLAPKGVNGPIFADLIDNASVWNGATLGGCIYEEDLIGPLAGASLEDLVAAAAAGEIYTNVHTTEYPGGEIRGQLKGGGAF